MPDKTKPAFIAEVDPAELAVRMCEVSYGLKRPPGASAQAALDAMDDDCRESWQRAAITALEYIRDCLAKGQRVS